MRRGCLALKMNLSMNNNCIETNRLSNAIRMTGRKEGERSREGRGSQVALFKQIDDGCFLLFFFCISIETSKAIDPFPFFFLLAPLNIGISGKEKEMRHKALKIRKERRPRLEDDIYTGWVFYFYFCFSLLSNLDG